MTREDVSVDGAGIAADWLLELPRRQPDAVALIDAQDGSTVTFAEMDAEARRVAGNLLAAGLQRGDRLAVLASNSVALAKLYFGCLYAGVCVVPLNPVLSDDEVGYILGHAGARHLAFDAPFTERLEPALDGWGVMGLVIDPAGTDPRRHPIGASVAGAPPVPEPLQACRDGEPALIVYTSGSTARPKGVVHRISSLIENARLYGDAMGIGPDSRFVNLLSMTYLGGYYNLLLLPYACGASTVITPGFSATSILSFWKPIAEHRVNTLWLVPSILSMLLRMDRGTEGEEHCHSVRPLVLCGTAPLPLPTRRAFESRYGVPIYENYALSETLFLTTAAPAEPSPDNSVGTLLDGIELRLVDNRGREVAGGEEGEIVVRTPYRFAGYLDEATGEVADPTEDGWLATGDVGRFLDEEHLAITGRKKDLIIRGGVNISPASIEEVLVSHPAVLECAVVGVTEPTAGEDVVAVLELAEGAALAAVEPELRALCTERLSSIKRPSRYLTLPDFPYTPNGKIQKAKVRAWAAGKLGLGPAADPPRAAAAAAAAPVLRPAKVMDDVGEAISIKYNNVVYDMQRRGEDVIVMSLGEAFFDIPLFGFDDLPFPALYHYSHSRGIPELRERLAEYFEDAYDVAFDPETEIIVTAGSKAAVFMALLAVVDPGDEVLFHEPAWVSYAEQVKLCRGIPVGVPYSCEVTDFDRFISNRTKMIIINSPNNPRGKTYSLEELTYLNQLARRHNLYILSDEAYSDFLLEHQQFVSLANIDLDKTHTIVVNSISKNFGISGWRLGYAITNEHLTHEILKLNQHLITCPATILQYYMAKHFTEIIEITKPQISAVVHKRRALDEYIREIGLETLAGESTFYFFLSLGDTTLSSVEFCDRLLAEDHVCMVPGIGYGDSCDGFVRVSIGAESLDRCKLALDRARALIAETS